MPNGQTTPGVWDAVAYPSRAGPEAAAQTRSIGRESPLSLRRTWPQLRLKGRLSGLTALAALLPILMTGWLLASPPGASPDDGYHLASIWCADGLKDGVCLEDPASPDLSRVLVPQAVLGISCFQYDGSRSAACTRQDFAATTQRFVPADTNILGERPTLYYRTMHRLIGDGSDIPAATARIRAANLVTVVAMVLLTAVAAQRRVRAAFLLSWAVASVPLGLFLMTSLNTSAWGLAGLTTLWVNALTALRHPERSNRIAGGILAATGLALSLGSRTEAVAHVVVIAAALAALWWWGLRRRERTTSRTSITRTALAAAAAITVVTVIGAVLLTVASDAARLTRIFTDLQDGHARIEARGVGDPFLSIIFEVPSLWAGGLGHIWGLGALDTPIPVLATIPLMAIFSGLLAVGLQQASSARVIAATMVGVALFAFPTFSLMRVGLLVYEQLQPRQFMAMLFLLLGLALLRLPNEQALVMGRGMRTTMVLGLGLAHSVALLVTIQRHTSGLLPGFLGEFRHVSLQSEIEWWWATAPHPNIVWAIASVAYVLSITVVANLFREDTQEVDRESSDSGRS